MALTMDQLNAAYENMSVYNTPYKNTADSSGLQTINIAEAPINNIQPYIQPMLPIIPQGGGGRDLDIFKSYSLYNDKFDPNYIRGMEKKTGLAALFELYQKYSPLANIMKMGKTGIETAKKYYADKEKEKFERERLEADAVVEENKRVAAVQAKLNEGTYGNQARIARSNQNVGGGKEGRAANTDNSRNTGTSQGYSQHYNKGGRIRYGTGGIVTL